ncbi:hypothetical protein HPP92_020125 [Vanilla planifolia]|uniref:Uncharacterized protein n=1 Tax=Vanilla planifolia TaxID=51239 RepID=A0A835Q867_VANPL|nr:hypothetical protein HPP92_020125 [Vanilla planifolia]
MKGMVRKLQILEYQEAEDLDSGSGHTLRGRIEGFGREVDFSLGGRRRRDDENHARKVKDEDVRRGRNDDARPRERSKLRLTDRNENIEDHTKNE